MSAELATTTHVGPTLALPDRMELARALAASDIIPRHYQGKPANVMVASLAADALGLDLFTALQELFVVSGKIGMSAGLTGALVRKAGHRLRVKESSAERAVVEIVRADDPEAPFTVTWTMEDANRAGLSGGSWQKFPAAMLAARATTACARLACPEALAGIAYSQDELSGGEIAADDVEPVTVTRATAPPTEDPWATTEADVVEGEIVEDPAGAVSEPASNGTGPAPVMSTRAEQTSASAAAKRLGAKSKADTLALCQWLTQRPIRHATDLTAAECAMVERLAADIDAFDAPERTAAVDQLWRDVAGMEVVPNVTAEQAATFAAAWSEAEARDESTGGAA